MIVLFVLLRGSISYLNSSAKSSNSAYFILGVAITLSELSIWKDDPKETVQLNRLFVFSLSPVIILSADKISFTLHKEVPWYALCHLVKAPKNPDLGRIAKNLQPIGTEYCVLGTPLDW